MVKSLFEEDDTTKARESTRGGEEKLTEVTSVGLNVLNVDARKTLSDGTGGLISGQNTFSRCADVGSVGNQLICVRLKTNIQINHHKRQQQRKLQIVNTD